MQMQASYQLASETPNTLHTRASDTATVPAAPDETLQVRQPCIGLLTVSKSRDPLRKQSPPPSKSVFLDSNQRRPLGLHLI